MLENDKSEERDPFLLRLGEAVDFTISILTADLWFVGIFLLVALLLGVSLLGLLLEVAIGAGVLAAVAVCFWLFCDLHPGE
ncbi:hypothetical protein ABWH98_09300 [Labrenzia sp. ac12]